MHKQSFVTLYVYNRCGFSKKAKDLCKQHKLKHKVHDMENLGGKENVIKELKKMRQIPKNSKHSTAPIVFVDGVFIGGCDKLESAIRKYIVYSK